MNDCPNENRKKMSALMKKKMKISKKIVKKIKHRKGFSVIYQQILLRWLKIIFCSNFIIIIPNNNNVRLVNYI